MSKRLSLPIDYHFTELRSICLVMVYPGLSLIHDRGEADDLLIIWLTLIAEVEAGGFSASLGQTELIRTQQSSKTTPGY